MNLAADAQHALGPRPTRMRRDPLQTGFLCGSESFGNASMPSADAFDLELRSRWRVQVDATPDRSIELMLHD